MYNIFRDFQRIFVFLSSVCVSSWTFCYVNLKGTERLLAQRETPSLLSKLILLKRLLGGTGYSSNNSFGISSSLKKARLLQIEFTLVRVIRSRKYREKYKENFSTPIRDRTDHLRLENRCANHLANNALRSKETCTTIYRASKFIDLSQISRFHSVEGFLY